MNSFLEIDFEIKTSAKKSRRFDLFEVIFKRVSFQLTYSLENDLGEVETS